MKKNDLAGMSPEQLQQQLQAAQATGQSLRFAHAISPLENPMRLREQRKQIARLQTEIKRRSTAAA
jgi:large subunit ribosomal protein L29